MKSRKSTLAYRRYEDTVSALSHHFLLFLTNKYSIRNLPKEPSPEANYQPSNTINPLNRFRLLIQPPMLKAEPPVECI